MNLTITDIFTVTQCR